MKKQNEIISDFEELFKLQEFYRDNKIDPYKCTYELICRSLKNEYIENINSKIERWVNVSHILYFQDVLPVKFYFQAKMLFRDGYYEASITLNRSICEMICYEMLKNQSHPFGDYKDIELENFRTLVKFLAIPKSITKSNFDKNIINKIQLAEDKNFIKASYQLNTLTDNYKFKIENGKTAKNLNRFFSIFESISFDQKDNFPNESFSIINKVYDDGNTYVHARKSNNTPKVDSINSLNGICQVLFELYGVKKLPIKNQIIKSGYTDFPDICTGMNFAIAVFLTPEDALRGYLNLPSQKQINNLISLQGLWNCEWQNKNHENIKGELNFYMDGEYLKASLKYSQSKRKNEVIDSLEIKLFGAYFHIKEFDSKNMIHNKEKHIHFEVEIFNSEILIGKNIPNDGIVLLKKV